MTAKTQRHLIAEIHYDKTRWAPEEAPTECTCKGWEGPYSGFQRHRLDADPTRKLTHGTHIISQGASKAFSIRSRGEKSR